VLRLEHAPGPIHQVLAHGLDTVDQLTLTIFSMTVMRVRMRAPNERQKMPSARPTRAMSTREATFPWSPW
jgi:hypothetical protein